MKKIKNLINVFLISSILINSTPVLTIAEKNTESQTQESTEIRNQNIYVPTKNGVQRATYDEAVRIDSLSKKPLTELSSSYILGDYKSGKILESYNIDSVVAMASTSKLVSMFVVLDEIKAGRIKEEDVVLIDKEAASKAGSSYKLKENDTRTVRQLMEASLIVSGNDAITALGKYIAGSTESFVEMMNKKCKKLGLTNAHMVNPTGLTDYTIEDYNKMTTREMFTLARELIKEHPEILEITSKPGIDESERNFVEYSTNPILGIVKGIDGLKTGYTNAAGRCLIATGKSEAIEGKTKETRLIGIIAGAKGDWQRYVAARKLMEEGLKNYKYTYIGDEEEPVTKIEVENASRKEVNLYEKERDAILWDGKSEISKKVEIQKGLKAPISAGTTVGKIIYSMNGEKVLTRDLIVKERVNQKGFIYILKDMYEDIFENMKKDAS